MVRCPIMEDKKLRGHVESFCEGLEFSVIPFHYEARHGVDAMTGAKRDAPVDQADVRDRNNHFEAWALTTHGVDLDKLPPKTQPLPPAWRGSQLFKYLHLYIMEFMPGSRAGAGETGPRFNVWHCWLCEMFVKFYPLLKCFQEPTLELHFLISNQQYKTEDRRARIGNERNSASQATSRAKQSKSR
jgi:hypothetical protein